MMLSRGQHVTITGAAGTVHAEAIHVETPANLPVVNTRGELHQIQAIMASRGIVQLAMLAHDHHGPTRLTSGGRPVTLPPGHNQVVFAALLDAAGNWTDLQGQALTITLGGDTMEFRRARLGHDRRHQHHRTLGRRAPRRHHSRQPRRRTDRMRRRLGADAQGLDVKIQRPYAVIIGLRRDD